MEQINKTAMMYAETLPFKELTVENEKTVRVILEELRLEDVALAVLVDGVKVDMDTIVKENQKVVILPIIAGG